jgi:hypothetical protein
MAVNIFIPQSPDPYLTNEAAMSLAKFGHINSLVGDINTKITGSVDNDNMFIFLPSQVDPATYPAQQQYTMIIGGVLTQGVGPIDTGYANTTIGIGASQVGNGNSYFNTVIGTFASISVAEPGNVVVGYAASANGPNNVSIGRSASAGSYGVAIGHPASAAFFNSIAIGYNAVAAVTNAVAIGNATSLFQIGGNFTPLARMHVRGLGNTNATTSLLIQNAAGTQRFAVDDAGRVTMNALPTSASGLTSGMLWNDAGTVKIIP